MGKPAKLQGPAKQHDVLWKEGAHHVGGSPCVSPGVCAHPHVHACMDVGFVYFNPLLDLAPVLSSWSQETLLLLDVVYLGMCGCGDSPT